MLSAVLHQELLMPRGDKSKCTGKQKRVAEHFENGHEDRGLSKKEAERRAWATVNATDHGGTPGGSGRGQTPSKAPAENGGQKGAGRRHLARRLSVSIVKESREHSQPLGRCEQGLIALRTGNHPKRGV
jgi:hypothetical protein